jgi:hypothetical protein
MARFHSDSAIEKSGRRDAAIIPLPWVARRPRPYPQPGLLDPDDYIVSTRALIGVTLFLVIFIGGCVWLMDTMQKNAAKEDCLMSGRKNCFPISTVK